MSRPLAAALSAACLLALPMAAQAAGWPMLGGDAGHSGHQAVDPPQLPATLDWHAAETAEPRTGVVLTHGATEADRRMAYGNETGGAGRIHLRALADGTELVAPGEQAVSPDGDSLGDGTEAVTPVDTSVTGPGQLFVVHNDDDSPAAQAAPDCTPLFRGTTASNNDVAIAQYDVASGDLVRDVAIGPPAGGQAPLGCPAISQLTDGYTVDSSPVLGPPSSSGARSLFFIARRDSGGSSRLFRVDIPRPTAKDSGIGVLNPQYVDVLDANAKASPTLAFLQSPSGTVELHVVVTRSTGPDVVAYRAQDLASGPQSPDFPGIPQTVTVPGAAGGGLPSPAPALYVALSHEGGTHVRRLAQSGTALTEAGPRSELTGLPSPGMAADGKALFVATSTGLTRLNRDTFAGEGFLAGSFARSAPIVSGSYVFAQSDDGSQLALTDRLVPVSAADFTESPDNAASTSVVGQPAYASGVLGFLSDRGAFAYTTGIFVPPPGGGGGGGATGPNQLPTATFAFAPNPGRAGQPVAFDASASKDPDGKIAKFEWDLDGNGTFETDTGASPLAAGTYKAGVYNVRLRVTDDRGGVGEAARQITVIGQAAKRERVRPAVSISVKPSRDRSAPFTYRVRGRLRLPQGVNRTAGCRGRVVVTVKRGKKSVLKRTARVNKRCAFKTRVSFRNRERIGAARKLRVGARFRGNRRLLPRSARSRIVRAG